MPQHASEVAKDQSESTGHRFLDPVVEMMNAKTRAGARLLEERLIAAGRRRSESVSEPMAQIVWKGTAREFGDTILDLHGRKLLDVPSKWVP